MSPSRMTSSNGWSRSSSSRGADSEGDRHHGTRARTGGPGLSDHRLRTLAARSSVGGEDSRGRRRLRADAIAAHGDAEESLVATALPGRDDVPDNGLRADDQAAAAQPL